MPPEIVTDSTKSILDVGVVGAVCVLLIVLLVVRERFWQKRETDLVSAYKAEIKEERDAHEKTRDVLLEEVRKGGDALATYRQQMQTQQGAFDTLMKLVRKDTA